MILAGETFRMGGHATHDEQDARRMISAETYAHWGKRDPIGLYEEYLKREGVSAADLEAIEREVTTEVDRAAEEALTSREGNMPPPESAIDGVYASGE